MPHQCTKCGKVFPDAAEEILKGCSCGSRFFYYIKQEKLDTLKKEAKEALHELDKADKIQIEKDIRELTGMDEKPEEPVILDLESVRVLRPGKFEIDIVNLFNKRRPLIYKLEEGKYIIDLSSSLKVDKDLVAQKIRDPTNFLKKSLNKKDKEVEEKDVDEDDKNEVDDMSEKSNQEESDEDNKNKEKDTSKENPDSDDQKDNDNKIEDASDNKEDSEKKKDKEK